MCNMERIGLTVSEEMSFENVDGRRSTDGRTCINKYVKILYNHFLNQKRFFLNIYIKEIAVEIVDIKL